MVGLRLARPSVLVVVPFLALSCTSSTKGANRTRQLEQCRVISHSGEELTRCLVTQHDWAADTALLEGLTFQAHLDSLRDSIQRIQDSIALAVADSLRLAREAAAAHVDPWTRCILHRDSIASGGSELFGPCKGLLPTGGMNLDSYFAARPRLERDQRELLSWAYTMTVTPSFSPKKTVH